MDHNFKMFLVLYGLSCVPWLIALFSDLDIGGRWGLALMDMALSVAAYIYLYRVIGFWFLLVFIIFMAGLGQILKALDLDGYNLT